MADPLASLPPGFKVDAPAADPMASLPPGFKIDDGEAPSWQKPYGFNDEMMEQGLMLGFGDEIGAGIVSGLEAVRSLIKGEKPKMGEAYNKQLETRRAARAEWQGKHPVAGVGAQVLGGALTMGAAPANAFARGAVAAPSLLSQAGRGSAVGAGYGGAAGFGMSEGGVENRLMGAAGGAAVGGAIGAALPVVTAGVGAGYRGARAALGMDSPDQVANAFIARSIERSGFTPDDISRGVSEANAMGVPAVPADVSPSLRRLGRAVETVPGRASDAATRFLEERQTGQGARVATLISRALGNDGDAVGMAESIVAARSAEARPLYQKAYEAQAWSDRLSGILQRPAAKQALARARRLAANEGVDPATLGITGFNEAGEPVLSSVPTMRTWDYIKRGLDDIIEKYRNPTTGRLQLDEAGRAINGLKSSLLRELDGINPDYAAARRAFAGHSEMLDAVNLGREFAKGDIDFVTRRFTEMSPAEQDMFRVGAVRELRRTIGKAGDGTDIVRTMFGSPEKRARLQMLFRDPEDFSVFQRIMELERETTRTNQTIRGGSPTGRIAAEQNDLALGAIQDAIQGNGPLTMARNAAVRMISKAKGLNEDVAARIAEYLFNRNPGANAAPDPALINSLLQQGTRNRAATSGASRALTVGAAPSSSDR